MDNVKTKELFCKPTAERALLSYCMKDIDNYYTIAASVSTKCFLDNQHKLIFSLMKNIVDRGASEIDLSIIISKAQDEGIFNVIGGYDYINSIEDMHVASANIDLFMEEVLEARTKYDLFIELNENIDDLLANAKDGKDSVELISKAETSILDLSVKSRAIKEPIDFADKAMEFIESRKDERILMSGLSTGFPVLDHQIDGMIPGSFMVFAARKKMGKSTLLTNIAVNVAYGQGVPVLYIDTEMSFLEWQTRVMAMLSGLEERLIKHGGYTDEQLNILMEKCVNIIKKGKLYHEYMPGYSLDKIKTLYRKYKMKHDIGLMVFDYLKEPQSDSLDRQRKEYQVLGDVTTAIKDLAGTLNIPALAAVQLNRSGDIADSDRVARYCDIVGNWMYRTEEEIEAGGEGSGNYKLVITDARRGGRTSEHGIGYEFAKKKLKITEAERQLTDYFNRGDEDDILE